MYVDNFERFGVTADCKKVLPGMIYVDLQEGRSRKDIYSAYSNGASVIFTSQNISDPELPVIKVNNVYETMLLMLNRHFKSPLEKVKLIAISGSSDKDIVLDLLHKILETGSSQGIDDAAKFNEYFEALNSLTIEDMYEYVGKLPSDNAHFMPIIVDYKLKYFKFINGFKFDCALITGVNGPELRDRNFVLGSIKSFISQIPENKPIIVNNDDDMTLKALEASRNTIVITYGLNKKAAVTATSIDINQQTTFNYCLQRSITTSSGTLLEPFEMPITINMLGSSSIYDALAAITCALYYDVDMMHIRRMLMSYTLPSRRFEIFEFNGTHILDNYCSSPNELDKTLEVLQMLNFKSVKLLLSINKNEDWKDGTDAIRLIRQWSEIINIEEAVLCGCLDADERLIPLSINDIRKLRKASEGSFAIKYFDKLIDSVGYLSSGIKAGDIIVLAGSNEMKDAKELLKKQLTLCKTMKNLH